MNENKNTTVPQVRKKQSTLPIVILTSVVTLIIAVGVWATAEWVLSVYRDRSSSEMSSFGKVEKDGNGALVQGTQDVSGLVEKVSSGVVSIVTTERTRNGRQYQAAGTGIIVTKNGYIVTNKHVVGASREVSVITSEGKTYEGVPVLGADPLNDVAFLKVPEVNDLKPIELGDSKTVRTGQAVIAIGNALGEYQNTVTTGIISGVGRPVQASSGQSMDDVESLTDLLQTDAAINQGNSGGPLLNASGQVIGINTAVAADAQGIGFAIPIGAVKGMLAHLVKTGKVERTFLGVEYLPVTPEVRSEYKLSVSNGNYVTSDPRKGSPADKAGVKKGDILTRVNGQAIEAGKSVSTLIGEFQPGDTVEVGILRGSSERSLRVTLGVYS